MKRVLVAVLWVWLVLPLDAGAAGLTVSSPQTDANGVVWYDAASSYNGPGPTTLRVLAPTTPAGTTRRFIYVLPVIDDVDVQDFFGDGLEELRTLNVHNDYNASIIAPSFRAVPWFADHDSNPDRRYESFMVQDLVPWVKANLAITGQEEHWLVGFSKSGFGAVTLLFRNPTVFAAAGAWDFPADQPDTSVWDMLDNYGSDANFQNNYRLTSAWIAARKGPFQATPRLWLSSDYATYFGYPTFLDEVDAFAGRLDANQVPFMRTGGATRPHAWNSGWLPEAVAGLQSMRFTARDDFNRPNGSLGANWATDPLWGPGVSVAGNQAGAQLYSGGAHFWSAKSFAPDQYSEVKISGAIGDWVGVAVRGRVSPGQGYWVAIKADGAYLYSFVNGAFSQLAHDATAWSTGDTLRLEVRTVASSTARLTVHRNGSPLLTVDDASHFIGSGNPGLGLYASTAISLDDWRGGELSGAQQAVVAGASSARDDFNRANGGLGSSWATDPSWGAGVTVFGNQAGAQLYGGGAHFWNADSFEADQYSQIKITGAIGDWVGVSVRGRVSPGQGYWLAIKADGADLYSFVNGSFHHLAHDATIWAGGDTLRLEARTVAAGTARLMVYRNGNPLFTVDDADHFIAGGNPGIGLYATTAISLDDWEGGVLTGNP
jgi:hypothetical protein